MDRKSIRAAAVGDAMRTLYTFHGHIDIPTWRRHRAVARDAPLPVHLAEESPPATNGSVTVEALRAFLGGFSSNGVCPDSFFSVSFLFFLCTSVVSPSLQLKDLSLPCVGLD